MIRSVRRYVAVCLQFGRSRSEPSAGTKIVTSATRIRICTARDKSLLRLEINWLGHQFHLETLITAFCFKDPAIDAAHPTNIFNTYVGLAPDGWMARLAQRQHGRLPTRESLGRMIRLPSSSKTRTAPSFSPSAVTWIVVTSRLI